jgi:phosphopantothenoylcysteine decarboxylase/phosphopantothenate--cysteine ligase
LKKEKARVTAVLTRAARKFVTPVSFEALTGHPCLTRMFKRVAPGETPFPHIEAAADADLFILAPATAHLIARLAGGLADELLTTLCLSARCPVLVCPAMNCNMWDHPATRRNVRILGELGYRLLGPAAGDLACGTTGTGRMVEPAEIVESVCGLLGTASRASEPGKEAKGRDRRRGRTSKRKPKGPNRKV